MSRERTQVEIDLEAQLAQLQARVTDLEKEIEIQDEQRSKLVDLHLEEENTLKAKIEAYERVCNGIYHAIRACSELTEGNGFGDIVPRNKNLRRAYEELEEVLNRTHKGESNDPKN